MSVKILPYSIGSKSARQLAAELNIRRLKVGDLDPAPETVICWGVAPRAAQDWLEEKSQNGDTYVVNDTESVRSASHKGKFFEMIEQYNHNMAVLTPVNIPEWTADCQVASEWVDRHGDPDMVVCRATLTGHSGEGIRILRADDPAIFDMDWRLYVRYMKKSEEYRVHIARTLVPDLETRLIGVQRKMRVRNVENPNWQIRNFQNGFVYGYTEEYPAEVLNQARAAMQATSLEFGAVDVIWNEARQLATVLEINTAPGLSDVSVKRYADVFKRLYFDKDF